MKKIVCSVLLSSLLLISRNAVAENRPDESLSFSLTDKREIITHDISDDLLLRVIKDRSGAGWDVWVDKKPFDKKTPNLLYHSLDWHGPYPSQIYAWQIVEKYFPNERRLQIRGYPYDVIIVLTNAAIDGQGHDSRFVSGNVTISWERKLK